MKDIESTYTGETCDSDSRSLAGQSPIDGYGCTADVLSMLAILTLGIGAGASAGQALAGIGIWLLLIGCLVHAWCFARRRNPICRRLGSTAEYRQSCTPTKCYRSYAPTAGRISLGYPK